METLHEKVEAELAKEGQSLSDPPSPVFETDGPPRAYFEVMDACENQRYRDGAVITRLVYRTIRCRSGSEAAVRGWIAGALDVIRKWCDENDAFIFWRARPSFEFTPERYDERPPTEEELDKNIEPELVHTPAYWVGRCRLITSWPMPEEIWARFEVKEGGEAHRV